MFRVRSARSSHSKMSRWASRCWSVRTATRSASWSSPEEGADPVQHQLGSLLDDPVADAVDQLDLEIAYAVGISVGQNSGVITGSSVPCQPADRHLDASVVILAAHPAQHLPGLKAAIPPRTGLRVPGLPHAFDVHADVLLGQPKPPPARAPQERTASRIADDPRADDRQHIGIWYQNRQMLRSAERLGFTQGATVFTPKKPVTFVRMAQHHDERDRSAPVVGDKLHRRHTQVIENGRQDPRPSRPWCSRARRRAPPRTAQVGAQHPVAVGGQRSDQVVPLPPVLRESRAPASPPAHRRARRRRHGSSRPDGTARSTYLCSTPSRAGIVTMDREGSGRRRLGQEPLDIRREAATQIVLMQPEHLVRRLDVSQPAALVARQIVGDCAVRASVR